MYNQSEQDHLLVKKSFEEVMNHKITAAMGAITVLPDEHLIDFNRIWANLIKDIEKYSNNNLTGKSALIIDKIIVSEAYNKNEISSKIDIAGRLEDLLKIVDSDKD